MTASELPEVTLNEAAHRFELHVDGHAAVEVFERFPGGIAYLHTIVPKALEGRGVVFLPDSAVTREVKQKRLMRADDGNADWEVEMEVRLYREHPSAQRPGKPVVSRLWDYLLQRSKSSTTRTPTQNPP